MYIITIAAQILYVANYMKMNENKVFEVTLTQNKNKQKKKTMPGERNSNVVKLHIWIIKQQFGAVFFLTMRLTILYNTDKM